MQIEEKYTLNPDLSGKFSVIQTIDVKKFRQIPSFPAFTSSSLLLAVIKETKGVETWTEAVAVDLQDGNIQLKFGGYFRNFNKVQIGGVHPETALNTMLDARKQGLMFNWLPNLPKLHAVRKNGEDNRLEIGMAAKVFLGPLLEKVTKEQAASAEASPGYVASKEIELNLKEVIERIRPMIKDARRTCLINFGKGKVNDLEVFTMVNPHTIKIDQNFDFMAENLASQLSDLTKDKSLMNSPSFLKVHLNCPFPGAKPNSNPATSTVTLDGPSFNFEEELAKAKLSQSESLKKLIEEAARK